MNSIKSTLYILAGMIFISAATTSCAVQKYQQPDLNIPETFKAGVEWTDNDENIAKISYNDFFKDPLLIRLIDKGMEKNNDLQVALKQIEFASLGFKQSKWEFAPKIDATLGSVTISRPSDHSMNGIMNAEFSDDKYTQDYHSSISISWEADIWGKIKGVKEEALVDYLQTQEAAKAVKTRLVSEIAQGYYNLLMLDKQLKINKDNLSLADSTLIILQKQYELGMVTSLAVQQQEIAVNQILKSIPLLESSVNTQENALSILTGEIPGNIERQSNLDATQLTDKFGIGIPSEMLSYRPDVKNSELMLRRSVASVHVAKVSMYPAINITAQGGLNSLTASNWFNVPGSLFGLATGTLAQPILQGRRLKTQYEQAKITSEQAEINFKQSVLIAFGEVSDALVQIEKLEARETIAENMVEQADDIVKNSLTLFQYNEATYLEVILAQSSKLQAELDLASIRTLRFNTIAVLYRTLGGGWQ